MSHNDIQEALKGSGGIDIPAKPTQQQEKKPEDRPTDTSQELISALKIADENATNQEFGNLVLGELKKLGINKSTLPELKQKVKDYVTNNPNLKNLDPKVLKPIKYGLMIALAKK